MMLRRRLLAGTALLPACTLALPRLAFAQARPVKRHALLIGNARYGDSPLPNPENDARLVATTLRSLGFDVEDHYNLPSREFKRVLRPFVRRMDEDRPLVFYYAGHGMQIARRNYLLPIDLNLRDEGELRDESVDLDDALLQYVGKQNEKPRVFIIDACRDNPFSTRDRGVRAAAGLAEAGAAGTLVSYSASPGQTAEDGPAGGNSVFTRTLAREMKTEGVEAEVMMKRVRVGVQRETRGRQFPFLNSAMVVDFFFNPGGAARPVPEVGVAPPAGAGRLLKVIIQAEPALNTDRAQASASLALRVYVLRDERAFSRAGFDALYDNDEGTLGAALLGVERLHLRPGEAREIELAVPPEARAIGVFGAFREVERAQWRGVLALPADVGAPLRVSAQARQLQLAWTR